MNTLAKLKAELKAKRENTILEFSDGPIMGDLSDLAEPQFDKLLEDAKFLRKARLVAEAKEADRQERERIEREIQ